MRGICAATFRWPVRFFSYLSPLSFESLSRLLVGCVSWREWCRCYFIHWKTPLRSCLSGHPYTLKNMTKEEWGPPLIITRVNIWQADVLEDTIEIKVPLDSFTLAQEREQDTATSQTTCWGINARKEMYDRLFFLRKRWMQVLLRLSSSIIY